MSDFSEVMSQLRTVLSNVHSYQREITNTLSGVTASDLGAYDPTESSNPQIQELFSKKSTLANSSSDIRATFAFIAAFRKLFRIEEKVYISSTTAVEVNKRVIINPTTIPSAGSDIGFSIDLPVSANEGDVVPFFVLADNIGQFNIGINRGGTQGTRIQSLAYSFAYYYHNNEWHSIDDTRDTYIRPKVIKNANGFATINEDHIEQYVKVKPGKTTPWVIPWPENYTIESSVVSSSRAYMRSDSLSSPPTIEVTSDARKNVLPDLHLEDTYDLGIVLDAVYSPRERRIYLLVNDNGTKKLDMLTVNVDGKYTREDRYQPHVVDQTSFALLKGANIDRSAWTVHDRVGGSGYAVTKYSVTQIGDPWQVSELGPNNYSSTLVDDTKVVFNRKDGWTNSFTAIYSTPSLKGRSVSSSDWLQVHWGDLSTYSTGPSNTEITNVDITGLDIKATDTHVYVMYTQPSRELVIEVYQIDYNIDGKTVNKLDHKTTNRLLVDALVGGGMKSPSFSIEHDRIYITYLGQADNTTSGYAVARINDDDTITLLTSSTGTINSNISNAVKTESFFSGGFFYFAYLSEGVAGLSLARINVFTDNIELSFKHTHSTRYMRDMILINDYIPKIFTMHDRSLVVNPSTDVYQGRSATFSLVEDDAEVYVQVKGSTANSRHLN